MLNSLHVLVHSERDDVLARADKKEKTCINANDVGFEQIKAVVEAHQRKNKMFNQIANYSKKPKFHSANVRN